MASLVPEPTEKCAVAAASPINTIFSCDQVSHNTRGKFSQAEPRKCAAFDMSGCPARYLANMRSQVQHDSSWLMPSKPNFRQVASEHSTMKVAVSESNWSACAQTQPCSVSSKMKVKASSNFCWVPSQTNLFLRNSIAGLKVWANSLRVLEFKPSAAITRSYSLASSLALVTSV